MRQCMDAENLHRRLKKIIGQVQAIDRMIDEDVPVRMYSLSSMPQSLLCISADRWSWKDISGTASGMESPMATRIRRSRALPRQWNAFPIWADRDPRLRLRPGIFELLDKPIPPMVYNTHTPLGIMGGVYE